MLILLFCSCCFAQVETTFDQDGENPSPQDGKNLEVIVRKLSVMLNNEIRERMSNIEADIEEVKGKLVRNEGMSVKNSDTIADVYSIAERNSAQITSVSEQHETRIRNNIQRLNSMDNKMVDMKVKLAKNEGKVVENSNRYTGWQSISEIMYASTVTSF